VQLDTGVGNVVRTAEYAVLTNLPHTSTTNSDLFYNPWLWQIPVTGTVNWTSLVLPMSGRDLSSRLHLRPKLKPKYLSEFHRVHSVWSNYMMFATSVNSVLARPSVPACGAAQAMLIP
jgi:hypothetical protein